MLNTGQLFTAEFRASEKDPGSVSAKKFRNTLKQLIV